MTDSTPNPGQGAGAPGSDITPERPVVALGGGPAGLTAGYLLAKQGKPVIVLESTDQVGGIARTEVRDGYRFDLGGHRFFTKVQGGRRPLARDHEGGVPQAAAPVADLLERQVPRLPAAGNGRDPEARAGRADPLRRLVPVGGGQAEGPRGHVRGVGVQPLRQAAVPALLQDLHREAVGRPLHRDPLGVGRPADQGAVVLRSGQGCVLRQRGQQDQVADLGVQLPALRPRPDVGADDRGHPRPRRRGPAERARHPPADRERPRRRSSSPAARRSPRAT